MRVETGIPGFDSLVGGGLPERRLYILSGPPGAGKTTFAARFITQCTHEGERGLFVSMHESREALKKSMAGFSFGFDHALEAGPVSFINVVESQNDQLITREVDGNYLTSANNQIRRITDFLNSHDVDRLVIDSTMVLRYFFAEDEDVFIQFLTGLKQANATILVISEMTDPTSYADEHYLADGVIFLHNFLDPEAGGMRRGLQIIKMRGIPIDTDIHRLSFSDSGINVHPDEKVQG